jgi:hypothetical protein
MTRIDDLEKIFIRAKVKGKYQSVSLKDCPLPQVESWFVDKLIDSAMPPGHNDEDHRKSAMVFVLEQLGFTIFKLKLEELEGESDVQEN